MTYKSYKTLDYEYVRQQKEARKIYMQHRQGFSLYNHDTYQDRGLRHQARAQVYGQIVNRDQLYEC